MKSSTIKKLEKKWKNLPLYFLDSSIFLEVLLGQERKEKCMKYFNLVGFKLRLETSNIVLGEVIDGILEESSQRLKEDAFLTLDALVNRKKINIRKSSFKCIERVSEIRNIESYIGPMDCIVFSNCIGSGCKKFLTLDHGFSSNLERKFGVKIINPKNP